MERIVGKSAGSTGTLAGNPIVVDFAPEMALLKRAQLLITHAGQNTILEAISQGVPMVALPRNVDQPAMAARVEYAGVGLRDSFGLTDPAILREDRPYPSGRYLSPTRPGSARVQSQGGRSRTGSRDRRKSARRPPTDHSAGDGYRTPNALIWRDSLKIGSRWRWISSLAGSMLPSPESISRNRQMEISVN